MKSKSAFYITIFLVVGIVLVVNILSDQFFARLDFTEDKQYTLSEASKDILENLKEPVTVTAYFSENLPPNIASTREDFKDLLIEYANVSDEMVAYEFINPNEDEKKEQEAFQDAISPVLVDTREKDQMKQQKAFLGAVVQLGDQKEVIPFVQPGSAMEYALSTSIKKISATEKPAIGYLQGHGEPSVQELPQANEALSVLYTLEPITLSDTTTIPSQYKTLAILAPKDSFPPSHLKQLESFLARGGNLYIGINRVNGDFQTAMGNNVETGLEGWLRSLGLEIEPAFVIDQNCGAVTVQQQLGPLTIPQNVPFPYLPIIVGFADHPASKGLEQVMFTFASPVKYIGNKNLKFTPLATSSDKSGVAKTPVTFDINKEWQEEDFTSSSVVVAGILEGKISGDKQSKIIVVSDGDFPINGAGQQARQLPPDHVNLFVNGIDFLSDDTGLIELRTKGVTSRPIDQLDDSTKATLKYLNFFLPILLVIIYGFVRIQIRRSVRTKRMAESYV